MANMIEVDHLSFSYEKRGKNILNDLTFAIEKGSVNVLIGLNGSGKTTLIKLLVGLLESTKGNIVIRGKNLETIGIRERSEIFAYVAQRSTSAGEYSVKDYLLFGKANQLKFYQSPTDADFSEVERQAQRLHVSHLLDKKLGELSGGERQIVAICCAVIQNSEIIILDEPTSALDIKNQHRVLALLKEIATEEGKTIILSSHNPNHALYLDSNVIVLKNGMLAACGRAADVVSVEKMSSIYGEDICYSAELPYREISFSDKKATGVKP